MAKAPLVNMIKEGCENVSALLNLLILYLLFENSISQFNSSTFSHIMPDEVREYMTRDQRPFLHTEYLQILQIASCMMELLLFSSPHSFSTGFRSEDWNGQSRSLVLCSVTHFCAGLYLNYYTVGRSKHGPL